MRLKDLAYDNASTLIVGALFFASSAMHISAILNALMQVMPTLRHVFDSKVM